MDLILNIFSASVFFFALSGGVPTPPYKVSYSGFVIPSTGELFVSRPDTFNYETTIESIREFLKTHPAPIGKKYALVVDNAPWHKKTMRLIETEKQSENADILEQVSFVKLPPYSPDFNPIEQVWRITRRENTHNVFFAAINALKEIIDQAFANRAVHDTQPASLCRYK